MSPTARAPHARSAPSHRVVVVASCALAVLGASQWPARARADGDVLARLHWQAPEGCFGAPELRGAVQAQLEREVFVDAGADLTVSGELASSDEGHYRIELRAATPAGQEVGVRVLEVESGDCAELLESVALVLAVLLNVRREELPPPPQAPWVPRLGVGAGLALGPLPRPALEVVASFSVEERGGFGIGAELSYAWSETAPAAEGTIDVTGAFARAVVQYTLVEGEVELAVRLGIGGGLLWVTASGFDRNDQGLAALLEIRAGLRLDVHLVDALYLHVTGDVGALPLPVAFHIRDVDGTRVPVFVPLPLLGSWTAGPALRFF